MLHSNGEAKGMLDLAADIAATITNLIRYQNFVAPVMNDQESLRSGLRGGIGISEGLQISIDGLYLSTAGERHDEKRLEVVV